LPLKHADLFIRIGTKPSGHGIILAGPPGTGKTLLARAVAGECGAHIEIVNGPALLSKWVGETEAAIRDVFERAQKFAPAVILFDEIDSIAPSRSAESAQHQVSTVAQLLVLLDDIEARGQIFVLATTNGTQPRLAIATLLALQCLLAAVSSPRRRPISILSCVAMARPLAMCPG
jgi:transitional endoplasmic reticulum ATPase